MTQTYNEFKVKFNGEKEIIKKEKTDRGTVRIDEFTANVNNEHMYSTFLYYEVAKKQPDVKPVSGVKPKQG